MKAYIKPNIEITSVDLQPLLDNSITSVTGLDGVEKGEGDFGGGPVDSRGSRSIWDDEE